MKFSITIKLWIIFLLLNIITITFLGTYSFYQAKQAIIERTFDQLTSVRIEKKNRIERFFSDRKREISLFATSLKAKELIINDISKTDNQFILSEYYASGINQFINKSGYYNDIYFIVYDTLFYHSNIKNNLEKLVLSKIVGKKEAITNKIEPNIPFVIESEIFSSIKSNPAIFLTYKIQVDLNKSVYILFKISHEAINNIMFENNIYNGLGNSGEVYLVGNDYLMRSKSRFQDSSVYRIKAQTEGVIKALNDNPGIDIINDYRNISVLSSYSKVTIDELNWVVLAELDSKEAMLPIYTIRNSILYLSIIISFLLIGAVALLSQLITLPIKRLKDATKKLSDGNYDTSIKTTSKDEIGQLTDTFNAMVLKIKEQTEKLKLERSMRLRSMLKGQEIERQRLSRELHDGLGQLILAMKMKLQQTINSPKEKSDKITSEVISHFDRAIKEVRDISNNLMPAELRDFGFEKALKELLKEIEKSTSITIDIAIKNEILFDNFEHQTYMYRIFQEALSNIIKHSKASTVKIRILNQMNNLRILISDNGNGFNKHISNTGNGISNMKERVNLLNGIFHIESNKNGTAINIEIPLNQLDNE
jgi:signal transduction histidine kinase